KWNEQLVSRAEELEAQNQPLSDEALYAAHQAFQAMLEGNGPVAWNLMLEAVALAEAQQVISEVIALQGQSRQAVEERLAVWRVAGQRLDAFVEELNRLEPRSMGGVAGLLQAHGMAARAREVLDFAELLANQALEHFPTAEDVEYRTVPERSLLEERTGRPGPSDDVRGHVGEEEPPWAEAIQFLVQAGVLYRSVDRVREAAEDMLIIGTVDDDLRSAPPAAQRVERL